MTTNTPGEDHSVELQTNQETQARQDSQAIRQDSQAERQDTQEAQMTVDRAQMITDRDSMSAIEVRLVDGLLAQGHLVDEIHDLQHSSSTIKKILAALAVAILLSIVANGVALYAISEIRDNTALDEVRDVERCKARNLVPLSVRDSFNNAYDALEALNPDPASVESIAKLRATILPAAETDIDCDGDGVVNDNDYPS